jgi:hypothetical protein
MNDIETRSPERGPVLWLYGPVVNSSRSYSRSDLITGAMLIQDSQ